MAGTFTCSLVTPENLLFEDEVSYVDLPAWDGQVGVQHLRAPLLVKLTFGTLRIELPGGESRRYFVGGGFAQVKDDKLAVLADEALPTDEIDREEAEAALKESLALRTAGDEGIARRDEAISRARAMVRALN